MINKAEINNKNKLKLTRDELNRLRDLILKELGKVNVEPSKEFPVAFWATWGEHPATGARARTLRW
jgi:hypothetical protein